MFEYSLTLESTFPELERQVTIRRSLLLGKIEALRDMVTDLLLTELKAEMQEFIEVNRLAAQPKGELNMANPVLVGDKSLRAMPYTQEATIRTHIKKLRHYIKLVDYYFFSSSI